MDDEMSKYSDSELTKFIENGNNMIDELQEEIKDIQADVAAFKSELERRVIEKLSIKKGDRILVTPDMYPKYAKYMIGETEPFEAVIDDIAAYDDDGIKAWSGNGGMTIEDALTMRRAYLEAHATESEVSDDE